LRTNIGADLRTEASPGIGRCAFGKGAVEALGVIVAFVAFGLAWAEFDYLFPAMRTPPPAEPRPSVWLVDGFNVLHASVLGGRDRAQWWTAPRRAEVLALADGLARDGAEVWVVFDGDRGECAETGRGGAQEVFATSADEWVLARVKASEAPSHIAVVTADRKLAGRARRRGAVVVSPRAFAEHCREGRDAARSS
jgi:predicted RNA-binding protein with PIN domain